jgi:hypothetical protein
MEGTKLRQSSINSLNLSQLGKWRQCLEPTTKCGTCTAYLPFCLHSLGNNKTYYILCSVIDGWRNFASSGNNMAPQTDYLIASFPLSFTCLDDKNNNNNWICFFTFALGREGANVWRCIQVETQLPRDQRLTDGGLIQLQELGVASNLSVKFV